MQIKLTNSLFYTRKEFIKLMMRTFIFLFCTALFSFTPKHAVSQNDRIVIEADQVISVDAVFKIIKAQTDYSFVYHQDLFKNLPKVQLKKGAIRLNKLLNQSISTSDINIIFTSSNTILIKETSNNGKSLQRSISGMVTDQSGLPLSGVTVRIKGTNKGTATDIDGLYAITVPDPANVLVFSSLGFETQGITVGNQTIINISLKESISTLDEVTISARYYNNPQRKETGAVSEMDAKAIEKQPVNNPLAAMQGHIPGVNISQNSGVPGGSYRIQIRGQSFIDLEGGVFSTKNDPLYVIDGVPFDSESFSANLAADIIPSGIVSPLNNINPADIETIEVLKDADATAIYGSRGANGVVLITTKKGKIGKTQIKLNVSSSLSEVTGFVDVLNTEQYLKVQREAFENEGFTLETFAESQNLSLDFYIFDKERNTDWQEVFLGGTAYRQNAQLSFSGGNEHTQFLLSGGYVSETTVFPGDSKYDKVSVLANINHQSKDNRFKLNFSANFGTDTNNLPGFDFTTIARTLPPNAPALYDDGGNLNWEIHEGSSTWQNPLAILERDYHARTRNLIANTVLSYRPIPALEFKASLGYSDYLLDSYRLVPNTSNDPTSVGSQDSSTSSITTNYGTRQSWIVEPQINWQHYWGEASLKVLIGTSFQQNKDQQLGIYAQNFASNKFLLNIGAAETQRVDVDDASEYKYHSVFGRINLDWVKYILNITWRRDGSSRFGPAKQFGNFGAIGAAWLFSEENILKENPVLSFGKFRTSYGITGSDSAPNYAFYDSFQVGGQYNGASLAPTRLFNPFFSWQESKKFEAALELGFFKDRIFLSMAWYRNLSSNQLLSIPLPTTTGFGGIFGNFDATVENKGFEVDLHTVNIKNEQFKWSTTFNISVNRNKLLKFDGLEDSTYANDLVVGEPLGIEKLYHTLGVDSETGIYQFEDYNNDGLINTDDEKWLADLTPKYFGGLGNTITYKNLQLDVFFQFTKKNARKYLTLFGSPGIFFNNVPVTYLDRWQQSGDQNPIQRYYLSGNRVATDADENYKMSSAIITDASFIRLRNVSLNYTVPKAYTKGLDINVYLHGQNLFVITKYDGPDPEAFSVNSLPPLRQITLGLNLGF